MRRLLVQLTSLLARLFGSAPAPVPIEIDDVPDPKIGDIEKVTVPSPAIKPSVLEPAWMKFARSQIGVTEVPGAGSSETVLSFYAKAGHPEIKDDSVPWCAAFANACLEQTGFSGSKSLMARSFLTWGKKVAKPVPGDITVLWRGSPTSAEGHVGFFVKEDATHVWLLGGNQGDQVKIEAFPKSRVLGYREPVTMANSRTAKASTAQMGLLALDGVAILESQGQINVIGDLIGQIGITIPSLLVASILLKIVLQCIIIYARNDDLKNKGR
jgi:uncharacterized protein (TIGR02594 family)